MEDTMQQYWAEEFQKMWAETEEYSCYMNTLAKEQEAVKNEILVLENLVRDKYIQLKKIESQLL